jgi:hypothetical protein
MKYTLIKGSFHVVGHSPDGDSIKFRAANSDLWNAIDTEHRDVFQKAFVEENGVVNLRLEGVDALETHYTPPTPALPSIKPLAGTGALSKPPPARTFGQPAELGRLAANQLMHLLGVTGAKWRVAGRAVYVAEALVNGLPIKTKLADTIPGYIVTGDIERRGRPVSWVFPGTTPLIDGAAIPRDGLAEMAPQSANYHLLRLGLVYPFFFMTLPAALRNQLATAVREARESAARAAGNPNPPANLWLLDRSTQGVDLSSIRVLTTEQAIFPYLFRKIVQHFQKFDLERQRAAQVSGVPVSDESVPLDGFFNDANPHVFVISEQDFLRLDDVVEAKGTLLRMRRGPHDLVFLS